MHEGIQNQTFKNHKVSIAESDYKIKLLTADSDIIDVISPLSSTFRKMYKLNKPIIHECHCSSFFSYLSYLNPDFVKAITFPSKCDMNAAQKYIRSNIPCYIVYNCLGNDFLNKDMYESKYNNKRIILWVGRIEHNKNWRMLIEIAKLLKSSYIIRVVTNSSVSMEYSKFIKEISRNNLNNKFEIINDCPYSSMQNHYIDASLNGCYLSTSLSESFGMTLLESMYCKCPMVLSNLPVFHEIAKDGALYFENNDSEKCVLSIEKICNDLKLRNILSKESQTTYENTYNNQKSCDYFINITNKILS